MKAPRPLRLRAKRTHCERGHAYTPENTRHHRGVQHCRACERFRRRQKSEAAGTTIEQVRARRFWSRVDKESGRWWNGSQCWEWRGPLDAQGYGIMTTGHRRRVKTHRLAYEWLVGTIPPGLEPDHLCRNRPCCNPAHLEPVTHRVNCLRGDSPTARRARQTECHRGHPFDAANTYITSAGYRKCRTCHRERAVARYHAGGSS